MKQCIIEDLDKISDITSKVTEIIKFQTKKPLETVAIFDLADSTGMKLKIGHDETVKKMFLHNQLCRQIIKRFKGQVIKDMGDGLLTRFEDPLNACLAAVNIQIATEKNNTVSKAALALGMVEEAKINNDVDIFGTTVDLCARIEKCTFPNQILIDRALHDVVKSMLADYADVKIGIPMQIVLKGYGKAELYEITSAKFELINSLNNPYYVNVSDGLSFDEKMKFIENAKTEVIEVGLDTKDIAEDPESYKLHLKKLLGAGVSYKIIILIPRLDVITNQTPKTESELFEEMKNIKKLTDELSRSALPGSLELLLCQEVPMYHAVCVDRHGNDGVMIVTNYLNGTKREKCPVLHFSKISNSETFKTYHESINHLIEVSVKQ